MEKSTKIGLTIAILIAVVALGVVVFKDNGVPLGGNAHYQKQSFIEGFYAGTSRQLEISRTGALTTSADVTITTAANATSTLVVGGIQMYATSSATQICVVPSILGATSTLSGTMYFTYGSCN